MPVGINGQFGETLAAFSTPSGRSLAFARLGFGGAPLGNFRRAVTEQEADTTVEAAWESGVRYFDTAPLYGHGLSEIRIGRALRRRKRDQFLVSTKVGRLLEPCAPGQEDSGIYVETPPLQVRFDYTGEGVMRSLEASLLRLGLDRVDIVYVHDLEPRTHGSEAAYGARLRELFDGGGWRALSDLRAAGAIAAIGLGVNEVSPCERLLALADPDLFLLAGRYTLLEQTPLASLFPACGERGVGIVAGGPYNSGVLVRPDGSFNYAPPPGSVLARVEALRRVCDEFGTPLAAVALQFVAAHPQVISVIPGGQSADEVRNNAAQFAEPVPERLWEALRAEGLIETAAPTPVRDVEAAC